MVTRNIQSSILFSLPFIGYQPANISNNEPALSSANIVKQTILGPPFCWPWNRGSYEIIVGYIQDYFIPATSFSHMEKVWLTDSKNKVYELTTVPSLTQDYAVQRPRSIAVQTQDDDGIVVRLNAIPDDSYILNGFYQKATLLMSSLAASWAPVPDHLGHIYDWGLLAMLGMITKDVRQQLFNQKFISHLLGAQDGLTAMQRNIFIGEWMKWAGDQQRNQITTQQGIAARSAS